MSSYNNSHGHERTVEASEGERSGCAIAAANAMAAAKAFAVAVAIAKCSLVNDN